MLRQESKASRARTSCCRRCVGSEFIMRLRGWTTCSQWHPRLHHLVNFDALAFDSASVLSTKTRIRSPRRTQRKSPAMADRQRSLCVLCRRVALRQRTRRAAGVRAKEGVAVAASGNRPCRTRGDGQDVRRSAECLYGGAWTAGWQFGRSGARESVHQFHAQDKWNSINLVVVSFLTLCALVCVHELVQ